jgi:hypothetical protein
MARTVIAESVWDYILEQDLEGCYFFEVVCGTVAIYTIAFKLNDDEIAAWKKEGEIALRHLAYKVRDYPKEYMKR